MRTVTELRLLARTLALELGFIIGSGGVRVIRALLPAEVDHAIGAAAAVTLGGAGTMAVAYFWSRWFPELRIARRMDQRG